MGKLSSSFTFTVLIILLITKKDINLYILIRVIVTTPQECQRGRSYFLSPCNDNETNLEPYFNQTFVAH